MSKETLRLLFVSAMLTLLSSLVGCDAAGGSGCDFRETGANGPEPRCQERTGLQGLPVFAATCEALEGVAIEGGCPREGAVVGCVIGSEPSGEVIDWYYAPKTREEAELDCQGEDGELREP